MKPSLYYYVSDLRVPDPEFDFDYSMFECGFDAYYNKVGRNDNPYVGDSGEVWLRGWDFAQSVDTKE
jgi:hypothetical protein